MTPDDWKQVIRDLPVAVLVLIGLWLFMGLVFAVVPAP